MNTTARISKAGKHFEIMVDMDKALEFKKGKGSAADFLEFPKIFKDAKKGETAASGDLNEAFGTEDVNVIAEKIVKDGEVLISQEHRDAEQEQKIKQVVDFLARNAVDPQSGNPHTADRIRGALEQAHLNITKEPIDKQIPEIIEKLSGFLPIKIETKKVRLKIPAMYTGHAYGVIAQYKESEKWLDNGDLEVVVAVPAGIVMDFYEKLNGVTHGAVVSEEM